MPSATIGSPLKRAKVRRSAMVSVTVPRSSSRTSPPPNSGIMVPARSLSVLAPARVRIAWSFLPISARPPATSTLVPRRLWLTLTAVSPIDCRRSGSSETRISRSTPPMRSTWATPRTPCSARLTTSSTK
ncbi:hypothetical protein ACVW04_000658 [Bradyrhizobium sp. LM2.3]